MATPVPCKLSYPVTNQSDHNLVYQHGHLSLVYTKFALVLNSYHLCGQLVIIGDKLLDQRLVSSEKSIHQLVDGRWVSIGSMSSGRRKCLVASPSPDKMVAVRGMDTSGNTSYIRQCRSVLLCRK